MFTSNPFAELSASISATVMQTYVVVMIILVVAGTLFDVVHKKSAKYFFQNWRRFVVGLLLEKWFLKLRVSKSPEASISRSEAKS